MISSLLATSMVVGVSAMPRGGRGLARNSVPGEQSGGDDHSGEVSGVTHIPTHSGTILDDETYAEFWPEDVSPSETTWLGQHQHVDNPGDLLLDSQEISWLDNELKCIDLPDTDSGISHSVEPHWFGFQAHASHGLSDQGQSHSVNPTPRHNADSNLARTQQSFGLPVTNDRSLDTGQDNSGSIPGASCDLYAISPKRRRVTESSQHSINSPGDSATVNEQTGTDMGTPLYENHCLSEDVNVVVMGADQMQGASAHSTPSHNVNSTRVHHHPSSGLPVTSHSGDFRGATMSMTGYQNNITHRDQNAVRGVKTSKNIHPHDGQSLDTGQDKSGNPVPLPGSKLSSFREPDFQFPPVRGNVDTGQDNSGNPGIATPMFTNTRFLEYSDVVVMGPSGTLIDGDLTEESLLQQLSAVIMLKSLFAGERRCVVLGGANNLYSLCLTDSWSKLNFSIKTESASTDEVTVITSCESPNLTHRQIEYRFLVAEFWFMCRDLPLYSIMMRSSKPPGIFYNGTELQLEEKGEQLSTGWLPQTPSFRPSDALRGEYLCGSTPRFKGSIAYLVSNASVPQSASGKSIRSLLYHLGASFQVSDKNLVFISDGVTQLLYRGVDSSVSSSPTYSVVFEESEHSPHKLIVKSPRGDTKAIDLVACTKLMQFARIPYSVRETIHSTIIQSVVRSDIQTT